MRHGARPRFKTRLPTIWAIPAMDLASFHILALAELESVHRLAYHLCRDPHAADELVQETYLRALRDADWFRPGEHGVRGAGPCGKPLPGTAHLLYRSVRPGSVKAVSVFVQSWHGQYPLGAGRLYTVSVASSPFPMLAWRTESVVYFLLADDEATERAAASLIRGAPATGTSEPDI
jgi:hypothetical protein